MRLRSLQLLPLPTAITPILQPNIHLLIIEAPHTRNSKTFSSRQCIPPDQILMFLPVDGHVLVVRDTFVGTLGDGVAVVEVHGVQGRVGEVVAGW